MRNIVVFVFILFTAFACEQDNPISTDVPHLRIKNGSSHIMENIQVNQTNYGSLLPGKSSAYIEVDYVYHYGYIKMNVGGKEFILQPIDYVGETKYEKGNFTYILSLGNINADPYGVISVHFQED